MKTIDKIMQCLIWTSNEFDSSSPEKVSNNQVIYFDSENNKCVLNIDGENIEFDDQFYTFEEFLMILTDNDEYLIEVMLGEIDLD